MEPLTEEEQAAYGEKMAKVLMLKKSKTHKDRWKTVYGNKTSLGLFRTLKGMIEDAESRASGSWYV